MMAMDFVFIFGEKADIQTIREIIDLF